MTYDWTTPPPNGETPGETAYNQWRRWLIESGKRKYQKWEALSPTSKEAWESVGEAIKHKYGAIY